MVTLATLIAASARITSKRTAVISFVRSGVRAEMLRRNCPRRSSLGRHGGPGGSVSDSR